MLSTSIYMMFWYRGGGCYIIHDCVMLRNLLENKPTDARHLESIGIGKAF